MTMDKKLKQALALQEKGDYTKAEAAFRQILKKNPYDTASHYSLGVLVLKRGDYEGALKCFDVAAKLKPDFALTWFNRGLVLQSLRRDEEALASYNRALEIDPECSQAKICRNQLTTVTNNVGEAENAAAVLKVYDDMRLRALQLQSNDQLVEARELFEQILQVSSTETVSLYSMAVIAIKTGNPIEALHYADRLTEVNPDYAPAWYNRGTILYSLRRSEEALACFDHALSINPLYSEALVNRGAVLQELNRHAEAVDNFDRLLLLEPENQKALANKGVLLTQFKRYDEAIIEFEKLLKINPDYDYLVGELCFAYLHICNWDKLEEISTLIAKGVNAGQRVSKSLALMAVSDKAHEHLLCSQIYSSNMCPPAEEKIWAGEKYTHDKIRIAYVSPDLRQHPVGHLMAGIFENHDKSKFEIISISLGIDDQSCLRSRFMKASDKFVDARQMNSRDIAELMRSLEVDIAIDLAGYTADSRTGVFAYRPAPVQVNYLGFAGTLGTEYMDYILADRHVIPEDDHANFSEEVVYLPDTYLPTDGSLRLSDRMPTREEYGLPSTGFIFCSFNHDYKINPPIFDLWMRLLKKVPGSILWLMKLNSSAEANLLKEAAIRGVEAERIIFATRVPNVEDHLARYQLAGLFLDTTPYNAHTTASDALRAGLPVLTCQGKAFPGRVAGSLLHAIGLPELIADSLVEYEDKAFQLATDTAKLDDIKRRLKANRNTYPLFNTVKFCRNLEAAYAGMYERYQSGKKPESFSVVDEKSACDLDASKITVNESEEQRHTVAILIPVYQEKLNEQEQFSIDFLRKNVTTRKMYFIAPESLNKKYYRGRYKNIEFKTFADKNFASIIGYNHLLLDVEFYRAFDEYDYMLIHQTDALMFHDDLDYWMNRNFDYIGAPWPNGVEVNLKVGKFSAGTGVNLKSYVGNGGFSLRSIKNTIALLNEFEDIKDYWITCGSSEDLFFAFMGMVSDKFSIPNQMIASRFSLELEPGKYFCLNNSELPTGCHAWWKHDPEFWKNIIAQAG